MCARHCIRYRGARLLLGLLGGFQAACFLGDDGKPRQGDSSAWVADQEGADRLGDLYAWDDNGRVVLALTYATGIEPGDNAVYDADLLYSIWMHFGPDREQPDRVIRIRFGQHVETSEWGVQIRHVPGALQDMVGPVEDTIETGTARAWVGMRDDPAFFDLEGWQQSLATQTLQFDHARDAYAGTNAMAIVIEFARSALGSSDETVSFHATVGRAR